MDPCTIFPIRHSDPDLREPRLVTKNFKISDNKVDIKIMKRSVSDVTCKNSCTQPEIKKRKKIHQNHANQKSSESSKINIYRPDNFQEIEVENCTIFKDKIFKVFDSNKKPGFSLATCKNTNLNTIKFLIKRGRKSKNHKFSRIDNKGHLSPIEMYHFIDGGGVMLFEEDVHVCDCDDFDKILKSNQISCLEFLNLLDKNLLSEALTVNNLLKQFSIYSKSRTLGNDQESEPEEVELPEHTNSSTQQRGYFKNQQNLVKKSIRNFKIDYFRRQHLSQELSLKFNKIFEKFYNSESIHLFSNKPIQFNIYLENFRKLGELKAFDPISDHVSDHQIFYKNFASWKEYKMFLKFLNKKLIESRQQKNLERLQGLQKMFDLHVPLGESLIADARKDDVASSASIKYFDISKESFGNESSIKAG